MGQAMKAVRSETSKQGIRAGASTGIALITTGIAKFAFHVPTKAAATLGAGAAGIGNILFDGIRSLTTVTKNAFKK